MEIHRLYARNNRVRLAYERRGEGPLLVLIQGLGMSGAMWMALADALAARGFTVLTPDNRGTGDSDAPYPPYSMTDLAHDTAAIIKDAAMGPAIVAGISLGGMIAQRLAIEEPSLVRGLVLACTTCGLPFCRLASPKVLWLMTRALVGDGKAARAFRNYLVHPASIAKYPKLFENWDNTIRSYPVRWQAVAGQLSAASTHSTGLSLSRINCPTVVLTGDGDQIVPPVNSVILTKRIPSAELRVITQAGHAFPLEAPKALPEAIFRVKALLE